VPIDKEAKSHLFLKTLQFVQKQFSDLHRPLGTDEEMPIFQHNKQMQYQTATETMAQGWSLSEL